MALPKKVKNSLPLIPEKVGRERRQEMLDDITDYGTYLPKGVLHADLDRGMLDFVKEDLKLVMEEKVVPTVDRIITNQNWSQFTETWDFQDLDRNISLPFIATVRTPEVKYGTFQGGAANIPNRRQFFYYSVPTWDGQRKGADVYKIPQFDYIKYNTLNMLSVDFLEETLKNNENCVVITHHVPSNSLIDVKYKTQNMSPYNQWFYCNMDELIEENKNKIKCYVY